MAGQESNTSKIVEDAMASARKSIGDLLYSQPNLGPLCLRIAFYDAISYKPIDKVDGPNGSIRICEGLDEEMKKAIQRLDDLKRDGDPKVWSYVSYADLYQLAGIEAVKRASGPSIDFQHGRMDSCIPIHQRNLPIIDDKVEDATPIKAIFHRIGFTDKEIVALSSAYYYWMNMPHSGSISTLPPPQINNSYYEKLLTKNDVVPKSNGYSNNSNEKQSNTTMSTSSFHYWKCLLLDASFRKHVELFAKDKDAFNKEYAAAHKKLSELGFKQFPEPIPMEENYHDMKNGIAFAVAMTILFGFMGFFYEIMKT